MDKNPFIYYPNAIITDKTNEGAIHPALRGNDDPYSGKRDRSWMQANKRNKERVVSDLGRKSFYLLTPKSGGQPRHAWLTREDYRAFKKKNTKWKIEQVNKPVNTPSGEGPERYMVNNWYRASIEIERIIKDLLYPY